MSSGGHIRSRSAGSWELRWRANGQTFTRTMRGSRKEAQTALRAALVAVDQGAHAKPHKLTTGELVRQRIDAWHAKGRITGRTKEGYDLGLARAATIVQTPLQALTIADVERWHQAMRERGLSASSIRAAHGLVRRAVADAVKLGLAARNVALDHGAPDVATAGTVTAPNADQVRELLAKLEGSEWRVPVTVALFCGLRRGELLALRWRDVELDGAKLTVAGALEQSKAGVRLKEPKTKSGRRSLSLPTIVVAALREHRQQQLKRALLLGLGRPPADALVFPAPDGGYDTPRAFTQRWERCAARLGMPEINWHSLRHAHASMLIGEGRPITEVADRLGHADPTVTLRTYSHLFSRDDRGAADAIDRMLMPPAKGV
jgi:integrase